MIAVIYQNKHATQDSLSSLLDKLKSIEESKSKQKSDINKNFKTIIPNESKPPKFRNYIQRNSKSLNKKKEESSSESLKTAEWNLSRHSNEVQENRDVDESNEIQNISVPQTKQTFRK